MSVLKPENFKDWFYIGDNEFGFASLGLKDKIEYVNSKTILKM